jgi:transposase
MAKQNRKYTIEFKEEAVKLALKSPSIQATSTELGVPLSTLHTWIHQLKERPTINTKPVNSEMAALLDENRRLHKALAIAQEEKEILKKAATYFAQHQK